MADKGNRFSKIHRRTEDNLANARIEQALRRLEDASKAGSEQLVDGIMGPKTEFALRTSAMSMDQLKEALWNAEQKIAELTRLLEERKDDEGYDLDDEPSLSEDEEDV